MDSLVVKKITLVFVLKYMFFPCLIFCQTNNTTEDNAIIKQMDALGSKYPSESIYLQTSKGIYETGEDLWFKGYVLHSQSLQPSLLSKTVYVQLIQEETNIAVSEEKYEIVNGFVDGHLHINDSLSNGDYRLAAYTSHSFYDNVREFYASKRIEIRKNVEPSLMISSEFTQPNFKKGDEIGLDIKVLSKEKNPIGKANVKAFLMQNKQLIHELQSKTDKEGKSSFTFPQQNGSTKLSIYITAKDKENKESILLPVPTEKDATLQFNLFPEGGYLISGLKSRLAFKAVNKEGESVLVKGTLYENNEPLLGFKSIHEGMGSMEFTPDGSKKYHIQLSVPNNKTYSLPEIKNQGISLRLLQMTKNFLLFEVNQSEGLSKSNINFRFQIRGKTYSALGTELDKSKIIKVPLNNVPQGIAEVTVFDENMRPVAERLVYVNQNRKLSIETSISDTYGVKEKATLKIKVTDENGQPVVSHLGISIFDALYENTKDTKNIMTHYMLSTQLKGNIRNPNYYFDNKNPNRLTALNLLLLTQGWRRYVWNKNNLKELKQKKVNVIFDGINGKVTLKQKHKNKPLSIPVLTAYDPNTFGLGSIMELDGAGNFTIGPNEFRIKEGGYIYAKLIASEPENFTVRIQDNAFETINSLINKQKSIYPLPKKVGEEQENIEAFKTPSNLIALNEVLLKSKKKRITRNKYLGKLDSLAKLNMTNDYVCLYNTLNCEKHTSPKEIRKPVEGEIYNYVMYWDTDEGRFIHGHPPAGQSFINPALPPYKYPVMTDKDLWEMFKIVRVKGYYGHKEFYQPNHDLEDNNMLDYRNTLFWSPDIITDENGEASIEFFCSDLNTRFKGVIEGVDGSGLLANKDFEFRVYKK